VDVSILSTLGNARSLFGSCCDLKGSLQHVGSDADGGATCPRTLALSAFESPLCNSAARPDWWRGRSAFRYGSIGHSSPL
jgi:hypothetical protein